MSQRVRTPDALFGKNAFSAKMTFHGKNGIVHRPCAYDERVKFKKKGNRASIKCIKVIMRDYLSI